MCVSLGWAGLTRLIELFNYLIMNSYCFYVCGMCISNCILNKNNKKNK